MICTTGLPGAGGRSFHLFPFRIIFCTAFALLLAVAGPVLAAEITIDPGTPGIIGTTIGSAGDGDTIILNPGTYPENDIPVGKNIIIRANTAAGGNAGDTIIDAGYRGRIFDNSGGYSLTIDNLTLENGQVSGSGGSIQNAGGAIYADHGTVTVNSSIIVNCSAKFGGAIQAYFTPLSITSTSFENCSVTGGSGGAIITHGGAIGISSSSFTNCTSSYGGGAIYIEDSSPLTIAASSFTGCRGSGGAGAIAANFGPITITSTTFSDCSGVYGGGAIYSSGTLTITASAFTNCSTTGDGGAIYSDHGTLMMTSVRSTNCSAEGGGGAIGGHGSTITIASSTFENCSANSGGALYGVPADQGSGQSENRVTLSGDRALMRVASGTFGIRPQMAKRKYNHQ